MPGRNRYSAAISILILSATAAHAAEKSQFTCTSGQLVRRVIIDVGDLATGLPCEVVYWKDTEAPGVRRVLWNARSDAAFCDQKAAGLVDKLAGAGWRCDTGGQAAAPAAAPATIEPRAQVPASPAADSSNALSAIEPAAAPTPANDLDASTSPQPAAPAANLPAPAATTTGDNLQSAALAPATSSAAVPTDQLESVIQANLTSLNQTVDGDFEAKIGDFGDLNADGIDDAVVFFNYESSTADFTQFVAAYLFNGESYHLAATKPVGGTDLAVRQVEVEDIVDGSIQLRLVLNDTSQAEDRRAAMVLRDGQLVEIE